MANEQVQDAHTDYRVGASQIPYQGPDRPEKSTRKKRIVLGVSLFVLIGVIATIFAWVRSVH